eukprot:CAMPEP_0172753142 /NCGR_PEP_ID=MMETSP1074-20121228/155298_1 /TAXON_ID=2916 /ORGANISM="Ceratium fusus, Strain PA161109" /LENGTH=47 /DNA_ID= /DNA_START= /DNA_END= /DNA_ORIENTATION=
MAEASFLGGAATAVPALRKEEAASRTTHGPPGAAEGGHSAGAEHDPV